MANTQQHGNGHDDHGAEHAASAGDIIPENSLQDKFLILLTAVCLISLVVYGIVWATTPISG